MAGSTRGFKSGDASVQIIVAMDNAREIENAISKAYMRGLEEVGLLAEGYAKKKCPVDTGRLRNSITHQLKGDSVYIGTNVEYGPHVELGTRKQKAQPFLRPAAQDHSSQYRKVIQSALQNG